MAKQGTKTAKKLQSAFHEMKENPPAILAKTRKKEGAAQANRQRVAIGLSKARAAGARIPKASGRLKNMAEG